MLHKGQGFFTVIMYGFLWGMLELTLGGFLHYIHFPQKGYVMGSIAYSILAVYVLKHKNIINPVIIGLIAASFKVFNIFIFGVPLFSRSIINPALAIIAEAASVTVVSFVVTRFFKVKIFN